MPITSLPLPSLARLAVIASLGLICQGCCSIPSRNEQLVAAREHTRQALFAVDRGHTEEARVRFEHALKSAPEDHRARHQYAKLLWKCEERDEAIEQLDEAVRRSGNDPYLKVELGEMLLAENVVAGAMECAEQALSRDHEIAAAWMLKGDALRAELKNEEARKAYFRALACEGCDPRALLELAELYRIQGRPRRALSSLQRLESEYPENRHPPQLAFLQGVALQALGRHHVAIEKLAKARETRGDDPETLLLLAESQFQVGRTKEAEVNLELARKELPHDTRIADLARRIQANGSRLATYYSP